jgi:hypothetical protein
MERLLFVWQISQKNDSEVLLATMALEGGGGGTDTQKALNELRKCLSGEQHGGSTNANSEVDQKRQKQ